MKHFPNPIRQCLITAVATSALFEAQALPLLTASASEASPAQTPATTPSRLQKNTVQTNVQTNTVQTAASKAIASPQMIIPPEVTATVREYTQAANVITPQSAASQPVSPVVAQPTTKTASVPAADFIPKGNIPAPLNSKQMVSEPPPAQQPLTSAAGETRLDVTAAGADQPGFNQPNSGAATDSPADSASTPDPADAATGESSVAIARRVLAEKLAAIVEQNKPSKEAQLQQNLVISAIRYAQIGQFERARQIAHHPALPPEIQADLLTKIADIEAEQTGQSAMAQGKVGQLKQAHSNQRGAFAPPTVSVPAADQRYSVVSSSAEFITPDLSDRCLDQVPTDASGNRPALPAKLKTTASVIRQLSQQSAARLASFSQPNRLQPETVPAQPIQESSATAALVSQMQQSQVLPETDEVNSNYPVRPDQIVALSNMSDPTSLNRSIAEIDLTQINPAPELVPEIGASLQNLQQNPLQAESAEQSNDEPELDRIMGDRKIDLLLVNPLHQVGLSLPLNLPVVIKSALGVFSPLFGDRPVQSAVSADAATDAQSPFSPDQARLSENSYQFSIQSQLPTFPIQEDSLLTPKSLVPKQELPQVQPQSQAKVAISTEAAQAVAYQRIAINCAQSGITPVSYEISPALSRQQGWVNMMFPLPISAVITSVFGWRIHPISGDRRFHTGVDLAAPTGTPVLAALPGRVVAADYMGGYGLAVVVEDASGTHRTLYGHLSAIAVEPGKRVSEGSVLGLVGSTGNSTGPHLHFEFQVAEDGSWTAIDPLAAAATDIAQVP